jgi:hypothetical protein
MMAARSLSDMAAHAGCTARERATEACTSSRLESASVSMTSPEKGDRTVITR